MKKSILAIMLIFTLVLTGCGGNRAEDQQNQINNDITIVDDVEDLEDGGCYVFRNDKYERLYVKNANYDLKDSNGDADDEHTLWYKDDWSKIPTMYKGDKLVYKTSDTLDEHFWLERFEYVGYTVGVTKLQQTDSGRFAFSTDPEERNINTESNAKELYSLPTEMCIIDRIGGGDLRAGNVSSGGCILGLEKDKTYLAEVYAGTYLNTFKLTADSIALTSMEFYDTVDYSFLQSQILEIHIPEYFNSGYYLINNFGLVRYINGTSYNEDTDFNIPNEPPAEEEYDDNETENVGGATDDFINDTGLVTETRKLDKDGSYTITIVYESIGSLNPPSAVIYNDQQGYQFRRSENNSLVRTDTFKAGEYTIDISDLYGREYEITVTYNGTFEAEG